MNEVMGVCKEVSEKVEEIGDDQAEGFKRMNIRITGLCSDERKRSEDVMLRLGEKAIEEKRNWAGKIVER